MFSIAHAAVSYTANKKRHFYGLKQISLPLFAHSCLKTVQVRKIKQLYDVFNITEMLLYRELFYQHGPAIKFHTLFTCKCMRADNQEVERKWIVLAQISERF